MTEIISRKENNLKIGAEREGENQILNHNINREKESTLQSEGGFSFIK